MCFIASGAQGQQASEPVNARLTSRSTRGREARFLCILQCSARPRSTRSFGDSQSHCRTDRAIDLLLVVGQTLLGACPVMPSHLVLCRRGLVGAFPLCQVERCTVQLPTIALQSDRFATHKLIAFSKSSCAARLRRRLMRHPLTVLQNISDPNLRTMRKLIDVSRSIVHTHTNSCPDQQNR